eukprot:gene15202-biopygen21697
MGPFASERGYTRRCGAHFKPLLAEFGHQNAPKSIKNVPPGRFSQWPARDAQKHNKELVHRCRRVQLHNYLQRKIMQENASFYMTAALTDARVASENTVFCAHPCVPSMGPIGSERVYPRRCGACFKPLLA